MQDYINCTYNYPRLWSDDRLNDYYYKENMELNNLNNKQS